MQLIVMRRAKRDRELVGHLERHRPWLCKPQVMRLGRLAAADQTRLRCDEGEVIAIPEALFLWQKVRPGGPLIHNR